MAIPHPEYPTLSIRIAANGEKAMPGCFFVTKSGWVLSTVASQAYGSGSTLTKTLRINGSEYNILNCVYRKDSTNCSSKVVNSELARVQKTWNPGAWLSMCPSDRGNIAMANGLAYQVIWIPGADGKEPWDLSGTPPPSTIKMPGVYAPTPGGTVSTPVLSPGDGETDGRITGEEPPEASQAGFNPKTLLIAGAAVVIIGGIAYFAKKRKKR